MSTTEKAVSVLSGRFREIIIICFIGAALFLLLSIATYSSSDPSWSHVGGSVVKNVGGRVGAWLADVLFYVFGYVAYAIPILFIVCAWVHLRTGKDEDASHYIMLKVFGLLLTLAALSSMVSLYVNAASSLPASSGGIVGSSIGAQLAHLLNRSGASILLLVIALSGVTLSMGVSWLQVSSKAWRTAVDNVKQSKVNWGALFKRSQSKAQPSASFATDTEASFTAPVLSEPVPKPAPAEKVVALSAVKERLKKKIEKKKSDSKKSKLISSYKRSALKKVDSKTTLDLSLLNEPSPTQQLKLSDEDLEALSRLVEEKLLDFGIEVRVVAVHPGPVITRFELSLAAGVKASRISILSTDLARSLSAISVRVVEVIPGKAVVGLELPNKHREIVYLREVFTAHQYQDAKSPVSLALGKDIAGHPVVVDLAKMPHLLVAGTTGSGKSVGLNSMLLSILFKSTPEEVRLILVDPKMLELSIYEGIPHLLSPVVTDMKEAAHALRWCVAEMERRYRLMASQGVRNLAGFNDKVKKAAADGKPIPAPEWYQTESNQLEPLPTIVVVIDEFADMIMVVGKKVEQLIARIAQKARAAGIHLILATQRPSVNVITGLIKANIPTRIAFQVSSKVDSRTILDQQGAQQLLGHGDMLYLAPGAGIPVRVHGAFVADEEVHRVVSEWKQYGEPNYLEMSVENREELGGLDVDIDEQDSEKDVLYDQAVQIVLETRRASISGVQRRLKIGYNRAARLIEAMEAAGLVGPMEQNGSREVLVPERQ